MSVIGIKKSNRGTTIQIRDPNEEKTHCITIKNMPGAEARNRIEFLFKRLQESENNEVWIRHYKNNGGNNEDGEQ